MKKSESIEIKKEDQATLDHAIGNILDALIFPMYIGKIVWIPILLGIAITVIITIINFDHWWSDLLFGLIAFVFMIPIIVIASPLLILHNIKKDLIETVQACINVSVSIASDTKGGEHDKQGTIQKSTRGVKSSLNHIVVPAVCAAANSRIPFFGRFFSFLLRRTTRKISGENDELLTQNHSFESNQKKNLKPPKAIAKIFNGLILLIAFFTAPIVFFCVLMIELLIVIFS
ncbi:MAG: hypothetical protein ACPGWM_02265 [Flavobacteriales bacterium]